MMSSFLDADGREVGPQGLLVGIGDEQCAFPFSCNRARRFLPSPVGLHGAHELPMKWANACDYKTRTPRTLLPVHGAALRLLTSPLPIVQGAALGVRTPPEAPWNDAVSSGAPVCAQWEARLRGRPRRCRIGQRSAASRRSRRRATARSQVGAFAPLLTRAATGTEWEPPFPL